MDSYTFVGFLSQLHCKFRFNGASTLTYQDGPWARSCSLSLRSYKLINHEGRLPFFQGLIEIYFFTVICWWAVTPWDPPNPLRFTAYSSSRFQFNVVCWWAVKPWKLQLIWGSLLTHLPGFSLTKKRENHEEKEKIKVVGIKIKHVNGVQTLEFLSIIGSYLKLNLNIGLFR